MTDRRENIRPFRKMTSTRLADSITATLSIGFTAGSRFVDLVEVIPAVAQLRQLPEHAQTPAALAALALRSHGVITARMNLNSSGIAFGILNAHEVGKKTVDAHWDPAQFDVTGSGSRSRLRTVQPISETVITFVDPTDFDFNQNGPMTLARANSLREGQYSASCPFNADVALDEGDDLTTPFLKWYARFVEIAEHSDLYGAPEFDPSEWQVTRGDEAVVRLNQTLQQLLPAGLERG